jgi:uncharacterized integral membrane protein
VTQLVVFMALLFSVVIAVFAVQNTTPVAVQFLTWRAETVAVSVLVLISAVMGAAAMLLLGASREVSLRWRQRAVAQQLKAAQTRVTELEAAQVQAPSLPAGDQAATTPGSPSEPTATRPVSASTTGEQRQHADGH